MGSYFRVRYTRTRTPPPRTLNLQTPNPTPYTLHPKRGLGSEKAKAFQSDYSLGVRQYVVKHFSEQEGWLISSRSDPSTYHSELLRSLNPTPHIPRPKPQTLNQARQGVN